ncbi:hypothetical protein [Paracoccus sp. T5]|uniref:hypothetical protein n=1 Tax=Paracoccus sp. T5 TaxID=3402161 RepID=UPI003ADB8EDE
MSWAAADFFLGLTMPAAFRYLTHPQVLIEPLKDVQKWSLNQIEGGRVSALAARLELFEGRRRIVSSDKTKTFETALPLAL